MNRADSKKIAETISNEQLKDMFEKAKSLITDWTKVSNVNKGMTKGAAWNILASNFDVNEKYHKLAKYNMLREYGEYLPDELKPVKKVKITPSYIHHEEPKFKGSGCCPECGEGYDNEEDWLELKECAICGHPKK